MWTHLTFAEPLFDAEFPKRFVLLLDLENDKNDAKGFAIVPDCVQKAKTSALDWEPLFTKSFPMFHRNSVHAIEKGEEGGFEYKGTGFTCMEDDLAPDVDATLMQIKDFWELHGFEITRLLTTSK